MTDYQSIKEILKAALGEKVRIVPVSSNKIDLIAVSEEFESIDSREGRKDFVRALLNLAGSTVDIGLMSLYTPEEAEEEEVEIQEEETSGYPVSWMELMKWSLQGKKIEKENKLPKVVAFYSFKGGVGRTTALIHSAWALANKGKKVVIVDLDFEAPSLHQAVGKMRLQPKHGLVDYLYERMNLPNDGTPRITVSNILGEVEVKKGRLFVVPAGKVDVDYITKVDDLRKMPIYDMQTWERFKEEIVRQVQPDFILIDSRTGINIWGALSILTIADDSVLFFNPNAQNREGVTTILTSLKNVGITPLVVMSPVIHMNGVGGIVAKTEWRKIHDAVEGKQPDEAIQKEKFPSKQDNPIMIPFETEIALAEHYPHQPSLYYYHEIVEFLDDKFDQPRLIELLRTVDREKVLESLEFVTIDKTTNPELIYKLFQKPSGFDRFVDLSTFIIRGRKGNGKTTLFDIAFRAGDVLRVYAPEDLRYVRPVLGYSGQETVDFFEIRDLLIRNDLTWKHFWQVQALVQLAMQSVTTLPMSKVIQEHFADKEPFDIVKNLLVEDEFVAKIEELLTEQRSYDKGEDLLCWLMYDDLEGQIMQLPFGSDIVEGLLKFAMFLDEAEIFHVGVKIFMENETWNLQDESVRRWFVGRDMELTWAWEDIIRLVFRQAMRSSEFKKLAERFTAITNVDTATDEMISDVMELLWGISFVEDGFDTVSEWLKTCLEDVYGSILPQPTLEALSSAIQFATIPYYLENAPRDRLLNVTALFHGIQVVSLKLCEEMKIEYKELEQMGFFDFITTLNSHFDDRILKDWWKHHASKEYATYNEFVKEIGKTGLIWILLDTTWYIRPLYAIGFGLYANEHWDQE